MQGGDQFSISQEKINYVMYLNEIKLFAKRKIKK